MPDQTKQSVSASQAAALFDQHPYFSRFMLYHHFKNNMPLDARGNERIAWGKLLQDDILYATSLAYRLEIEQNTTDEYIRAGYLGATVDGRTHMPDRGLVVVEAKNVDWLRWRDTWTETAAALHVEIQVQTQMLAAGANHGIIAALIGGNEIRWYERERNGEMQDRLREEAALFFESLETNREPDPIGSPMELPMLAALYPTVDPLSVVEALGDEDLALAARQYKWAHDQKAFAGKLEDQMKAKILARAGDAGVLLVDGARVAIAKSPVTGQICEPHAEPKQLRKPSIQTRIAVHEAPAEGVPVLANLERHLLA